MLDFTNTKVINGIKLCGGHCNMYKVILALRRLFYRVICKIKGEIYFSKYNDQGAYHWEIYYNHIDMLYVELVNTVCALVAPETKVLDIGCGDGLISNVLAEVKKCQVIGIDNHPVAIQLAKQKNMNSNKFFCKSVYSIHYMRKFDVVIAIEIFEHLRNPISLLEKAFKALKDDGVLIISTPISDWTDVFHVRNYSIEEFESALSTYFTIVERKDSGRNTEDAKYYTHICVCKKS